MEEHSETADEVDSSDLSDFEDMGKWSKDPSTMEELQDMEEVKNLKCLWQGCGKKYTSVDSLAHHLNDAHVGNNPGQYACQWLFCSRKGILQPSRFSLITHLRSHTGEKPYCCPLPNCVRTFTRSDAITKHLKSVHDVDLGKVEDTEVDPWWFAGSDGNGTDFRKFEPSKDGLDVDVLLEDTSRLRGEKLASQRFSLLQKVVLDGSIAVDDPALYERVFNIQGNDANTQLKGSLIYQAMESTKQILPGNVSVDDIDVDEVQDLEALAENLEEYYQKLLKFKELASEELQNNIKDRRKLWVKKELVLDAILQNEIRGADKFM
ncbi:unnamed protein product [Kuraishia capsulata CBS 1993]|uniref:C2H2-type domain-containing protein n=1 Tax=Kuraishia capsulata CBS 1993 TaxID=1382522 RepID=W6MWH1_9ASCO|nr:uncharacterized protein KUCA_T00003413001 [Kuraishia capsulata CBS 1993]CDK27435.1 unnamed protein product [Kuraishia capsulata CBS 1993]